MYMDDVSNTDIQCLVVQAEKDIIIESFATEAATTRFWEMLPLKSVRHTIRQGTHSGFASYISQWKPELDGIPELEQQKEAVRVTVDFLQNEQTKRQ